MSKYTKSVKRVVRTYLQQKPFPDLVVAVSEYPNALGVRVFENNIMGYSESRRVQIMEYLENLRAAIELCGVECFIEGAKGDPPRRRV